MRIHFIQNSARLHPGRLPHHCADQFSQGWVLWVAFVYTKARKAPNRWGETVGGGNKSQINRINVFRSGMIISYYFWVEEWKRTEIRTKVDPCPVSQAKRALQWRNLIIVKHPISKKKLYSKPADLINIYKFTKLNCPELNIKYDSLIIKLPFGLRSCDVAPIWVDVEISWPHKTAPSTPGPDRRVRQLKELPAHKLEESRFKTWIIYTQIYIYISLCINRAI